ncbi:tail fiber domain-containing protein [Salmonella enterica]|uniref:tail fiber domain-containing protein n=1 Tax=Salmonella enterica TaxID=28901 RepID=UPI003525BC21
MSDRRLKTDLKPLEETALDVVDRLHAYEFTWNDHPENVSLRRNGEHSVGLIAQDVQASGAGECIIQRTTSGDEPLLAVDYVKLVPYLVESVRTLRRRTASLESTRKRKRSSKYSHG